MSDNGTIEDLIDALAEAGGAPPAAAPADARWSPAARAFVGLAVGLAAGAAVYGFYLLAFAPRARLAPEVQPPGGGPQLQPGVPVTEVEVRRFARMPDSFHLRPSAVRQSIGPTRPAGLVVEMIEEASPPITRGPSESLWRVRLPSGETGWVFIHSRFIQPPGWSP